MGRSSVMVAFRSLLVKARLFGIVDKLISIYKVIIRNFLIVQLPPNNIQVFLLNARMFGVNKPRIMRKVIMIFLIICCPLTRTLNVTSV